MVAHEGHDTTTTSTATPVQAMDMEGMGESASMMQMVFFTATNTPLYSTSWTPSSAGAYAGTCIFLIFFAVLLRVLLSVKAYLDAKALQSALKRRYVVVEGEGPEKIASDDSSTTGILTENGVAQNVRIAQAPTMRIQPWRFSVDLPRAALMTVIAGVSYLLMLAVMTLNVGYFLSVLGGVFLGEMAFGRFHHNVGHSH